MRAITLTSNIPSRTAHVAKVALAEGIKVSSGVAYSLATRDLAHVHHNIFISKSIGDVIGAVLKDTGTIKRYFNPINMIEAATLLLKSGLKNKI